MSSEVAAVEQADREAAWNVIHAYRAKDHLWKRRVASGEADDGAIVQAFARHRQQAEARATSVPEGWRPIAEADRTQDLIVGCWVDDDDDSTGFWSAWVAPAGEPLGCDGTWGDGPTHAMPLLCPPTRLASQERSA